MNTTDLMNSGESWVKKISEVQAIIDTSPKYRDCLLLPIGLTDSKCNDLVLSCRGKLPNNNAYIIYGSCIEEIDNFLTGMLLNACRKYNSEELKISYYNCSTGRPTLPFLREMSNIKLIKTITTSNEFEKELECLRSICEERLEKIFQYNDCYARAIRVEQERFLTEMPQELIIFYVSQYTFTNWRVENEFNYFITQKLWRTGIYPIIIVEDVYDCLPFDYYYGGKLWLSSAQRLPIKLEKYQAYMHIAEDSWCFGTERKEVIDIPQYTEDWIRQSIKEIRANIK